MLTIPRYTDCLNADDCAHDILVWAGAIDKKKPIKLLDLIAHLYLHADFVDKLRAAVKDGGPVVLRPYAFCIDHGYANSCTADTALSVAATIRE